MDYASPVGVNQSWDIYLHLDPNPAAMQVTAVDPGLITSTEAQSYGVHNSENLGKGFHKVESTQWHVIIINM